MSEHISQSRKIQFQLRDWQEYLFIIRDRWLIALISALIVAGLCLCYMLTRPTLYSSSALVVVEENTETILDTIEGVIDSSSSNTQKGGLSSGDLFYAQLQSRTFHMRAIKNMPEELSAKIKAAYRTSTDPEPNVAKIVKNAENIVFDKKFFRFRFTLCDPELAAELANYYVAESIRFSMDKVSSSETFALSFLTQHTEELQAKVTQGEKALLDYRRVNDFNVVEGQNLITDRISALSEQLVEVEITKLLMEVEMEQIKKPEISEAELLNIPFIAEYDNLSDLIQQRQELATQQELFKRRYLERHPKVIDVQKQIEILNQYITDGTGRACAIWDNQYGEVLKRYALLKQQLDQAKKDFLNFCHLEIDYNVLERKFEKDQNIFNLVFTRLNEILITSQLERSSIKVIDYAVPPIQPVQPDQVTSFFLSGMLFFICFIGVPIGFDLIQMLRGQNKINLES